MIILKIVQKVCKQTNRKEIERQTQSIYIMCTHSHSEAKVDLGRHEIEGTPSLATPGSQKHFVSKTGKLRKGFPDSPYYYSSQHQGV